MPSMVYEESPDTIGVGLIELIREDYVHHRRDWTRPGFRAMAVYRFGVWRMRLKSRWARLPLSFLYRRLHLRVRNHYGIELPHSARVGRRVVIEHQHGIVIHGHARIGNDCYIRQGVTIGNKTIDRPYDAATIGNGVNIGAGAKILGKLTIGDGASIGANAVVLKDVPAGTIAVGIPAKIYGNPEGHAPVEQIRAVS
jgi:serine acetyltransferase